MSNNVKIAIDAMGGEGAPKKILDGIEISLKTNNKNFFYLYGKKEVLEDEVNKRRLLKEFCEIIDTQDIILDNESPLEAAKKSKDTSMWRTIESLKEGKSDISLSAGNTGALLVISRLLLKTISGISKPALAGLWPNQNNMNVVLDLGANIECNEKNLIDFSLMGSALHKALFPEELPKVALLNIGSEELKGNNIIRNTYQELSNKKNNLYEFKGYIEGNHIMEGEINVIVTDGFTGNVALKTAEGTANFITSELKKALSSTIMGKISSFLNIKNLTNFKKKLDPRVYNGAILLGLKSPVIKSHGSTDYIGFYNSLKVCEKTIKGRLIEKIKENIN